MATTAPAPVRPFAPSARMPTRRVAAPLGSSGGPGSARVLDVAAGALEALALTRALESLLFEVSPHDPRVVGAGALLVLVIGGAAS